MLAITLEKLKTGTLRATGLVDGVTVEWEEGQDGRALVAAVLRAAAWMHDRGGENYDMTFIRMNSAAEAVWS